MNSNTAVTDEERIALGTLTYVTEPGDPLTATLTRLAGGVQTLEMIRSGSLIGITGLPRSPELKFALDRLRTRLATAPPRQTIRRTLENGRFRLVCPGDPGWPGWLDELGASVPVALWVTGTADLAFCCQRSVAVTGSRAATAYGSYLAAELSGSLATSGLTVVAGGSFGIDAAAHRAALSNDRATIAILPCGIDVPYPAAHAALFDAITTRAASGALVSEVPPGRLPSRLRFQARNRIIAALASATVVVETAASGGAVSVARCARSLGRPVMAVPGPVTSALSAGCNDLIRSGQAVLVTSASDIIDTLPATPRPAD